MSKKTDKTNPFFNLDNKIGQEYQETINNLKQRFNKQYQQENFNLPPEVEAMPIFREWVTGSLNQKIYSPFWEIIKITKNQRCLDLGCGISFLIYPWTEWNAYFYGQEISNVAQTILNSRSPQLNSKLYKGVQLLPAHQLNYEEGFFDLVIATGWSCYYPLAYWEEIISAVKKVLKPGGFFVFDILNPEKELAEDWALLETYLGTEVLLTAIAEWEKMIKGKGGKVGKKLSGELFDLYKISF
jgi:SAM-dependent methyltransferase